MDKNVTLTFRMTPREKGKVYECASLMGVSAGEFVRRSMMVMLMAMGDKESERKIRGILREATGYIKLGAGRQPVPPAHGRVTGTHPLFSKIREKGRKSGK